MTLTDSLASVTAQTLPVLAFAATLEILTIHRSYSSELRFLRNLVRERPTRWATRLALGLAVARWVLVVIYLALIVCAIRAEWLCLRVLGGETGLSGHGGDIEFAMIASFVAVALIPITPALLRMQSLRTIRKDIGLND
ncbi:hypothetical protein [Paractinoplanes toevensis]|uniref:Uncharacterized protein n=1 Tax=Paractinoplanes toevensis TaxID=571911 RepID=A0A919T8V2_9ACTN|nr:hypothetical protein [Actinoplanes toevensis]GIM90832.1 hypothetical protein Ato02nite_026250 [Actinoplanes toevensis]